MVTQQVHARVIYGMGAPCDALLPREEVESSPVSEVVNRVISSPQPSEPARRAASVLAEAIRNRRVLNVEVVRGTNGDAAVGQPVSLHDVMPPKRQDPTSIPEEVTVRVSEPWVGGVRVSEDF